MPAIAKTSTSLATRFVDRLNGVFGYKQAGNGGQTLYPAQSGNPIALQFSLSSELMNKLRVEMDRLTTLDDINRMLEEDCFLAGNVDKLMALIANYEPKITFAGSRSAEAAAVTTSFLKDRIDYTGLRTDYLWRLVMWGDLFLQKNMVLDPSLAAELATNGSAKVAQEIVRGRRIGYIADVLDLPAHTMFRQSNPQDRFDDVKRAFIQVPEGAARFGNPTQAMDAIPLPLYAIEHARWTNRRQRLSRYGRPALKSLRAQYNKVEVSKFDMLLARHTHSTQILVFYLNQEVATGQAPGEGVTQKDLEEFYRSTLMPRKGEFTEISPDTNFVLPGQHKVEAVGSAGQFSTSVPEDLYLQIELLMQGLWCHPRLFGYQHGSSTSGDALKVMLWMSDEFGDEVRRQEWRQILRPLILWNLWLNGIFAADPSVEWVPKRPPIQLNKEAKPAGAPTPKPGPANPASGGAGGGTGNA